jgi:hypothetical protein
MLSWPNVLVDGSASPQNILMRSGPLLLASRSSVRSNKKKAKPITATRRLSGGKNGKSSSVFINFLIIHQGGSNMRHKGSYSQVNATERTVDPDHPSLTVLIDSPNISFPTAPWCRLMDFVLSICIFVTYIRCFSWKMAYLILGLGAKTLFLFALLVSTFHCLHPSICSTHTLNNYTTITPYNLGYSVLTRRSLKKSYQWRPIKRESESREHWKKNATSLQLQHLLALQQRRG